MISEKASCARISFYFVETLVGDAKRRIVQVGRRRRCASWSTFFPHAGGSRRVSV